MTAGPYRGEVRVQWTDGEPRQIELEVWTGEVWARLAPPVEPLARIKQLEAQVAQLEERWRTRHYER